MKTEHEQTAEEITITLMGYVSNELFGDTYCKWEIMTTTHLERDYFENPGDRNIILQTPTGKLFEYLYWLAKIIKHVAPLGLQVSLTFDEANENMQPCPSSLPLQEKKILFSTFMVWYFG